MPKYEYACIKCDRSYEKERRIHEEATLTLMPIDFSGVYAGMASDAIGEAYCTTDFCEVKLIKDN